MKTQLLCIAGILTFCVIASAAPTPSGSGPMGTHCGGCHALPPGTGPDDGRFKPGSHVEHTKFACERCHPTGLADTTETHVNGMIDIRPDIEYHYGTKVPWPSLGSGSCGGLGHPYPPIGCHQQMPDATCFWVPGKKCQAPGPR